MCLDRLLLFNCFVCVFIGHLYAQLGIVTSTPNTSREQVSNKSDLSIVERTPSPPLEVSDTSLPADASATRCDCGLRRSDSVVKHIKKLFVKKPHCLSRSLDLSDTSLPADAAATQCGLGPTGKKRCKKKTCKNPHCLSRSLELSDRSLPAEDSATHCECGLWRSVKKQSKKKMCRKAHASAGHSASDTEARARCLEDSLEAAMRVLKNKEETVRVQAESLAMAEERLTALGQSRSRNSSDGCQCNMSDVSNTTQLKENKEMVKTLQDNLSVIEDLYRECFYETARQDEIIALLRETCRGHDRATNTRTRRERDIAMEVENLKVEISNFLNNSTNNDSGVWETGGGAGRAGPGEGGEVSVELRGVAEQLRRLWDVMQADCTCGMVEENMTLKKANETMQIEMQELREKVKNLEDALENKENLDQQYQQQLADKEQELQHLKKQLSDLTRVKRDQGSGCNTLSCQIKQLEGMLNDKSEELVIIQQQRASQETTIRQLREELGKAESVVKDSASVRSEVWSLSAQVRAWRAQLADGARQLRHLRRELRRARAHCQHLAHQYTEKCLVSEELRSELRRARAGGAELCGEARGALRAARAGLRALREHAREREEKICQQEKIIRSLRENSTRTVSKRASVDENEPCCSRYLGEVERKRSDYSHASASEMPCQCTWLNGRTSESEMANSPSPPTPPKRLLRKKPLSVDRRCQWPQVREAAVCCPPTRSPMSSIADRELSTDSLLERVERTHEALELAHRRWCRRGLAHDRTAASPDAD